MWPKIIVKFCFLKVIDYHFIIIYRSCTWFKNNWAFDINYFAQFFTHSRVRGRTHTHLILRARACVCVQHEKYEKNWYSTKEILRYKNKCGDKFYNFAYTWNKVNTMWYDCARCIAHWCNKLIDSNQAPHPLQQ